MNVVMDIQTGQMLTVKLQSQALSSYWRLVLSEYDDVPTYNSCSAFANEENPPKDLFTSKEAAESSKTLEEIQKDLENEERDEMIIAQEEDSEQMEANGIENALVFKSLSSIQEMDMHFEKRSNANLPCPSQKIIDESRKQCILAPGSEDETVYHILDSGRPGPLTVVVAGVHGNEGAGVVAARHVSKHWRPSYGTLVVLERANARGVAANFRGVPQISRDIPAYDLNRAFLQVPETDLSARVLVLAIWELLSELKPDMFFDLHEGRSFFAGSTSPDQLKEQDDGVLENVGSTTGGKISKGNSVVTTINGERLAKVVADACNENIDNPDRKFYVMAPPIKEGLAAKVHRTFGTIAMLFETTLVFPLETRARQHLFMLAVALRSVGVLPPDFDLSVGGNVEGCVVTRKGCMVKP